jgi:uncharacterized protein with HEPN domain
MSRHSPEVRLRHMLDHAREALDLDILWDTVSAELPDLIVSLQAILPPEEHE